MTWHHNLPLSPLTTYLWHFVWLCNAFLNQRRYFVRLQPVDELWKAISQLINSWKQNWQQAIMFVYWNYMHLAYCIYTVSGRGVGGWQVLIKQRRRVSFLPSAVDLHHTRDINFWMDCWVVFKGVPVCSPSPPPSPTAKVCSPEILRFWLI